MPKFTSPPVHSVDPKVCDAILVREGPQAPSGRKTKVNAVCGGRGLVYNSRQRHGEVWRRYECSLCAFRWTTIEVRKS